jgi:hypothetical protein
VHGQGICVTDPQLARALLRCKQLDKFHYQYSQLYPVGAPFLCCCTPRVAASMLEQCSCVQSSNSPCRMNTILCAAKQSFLIITNRLGL